MFESTGARQLKEWNLAKVAKQSNSGYVKNMKADESLKKDKATKLRKKASR